LQCQALADTIKRGINIKKILVVEDEDELASVLSQALSESGYSVTTASDGKTALKRLRHESFDLAIVDVMLPQMNGLELIKQAREELIDLPIIVLTAKDRVTDRIAGLDIGADDYITKPFVLAELMARVRAGLRRQVESMRTFEFQDLHIDFVSRKVRRDGREVYLSPTEFALLEVLVQSAGKPVSKATLLERVWHDSHFRDDNIVEVYASYLRQKLEARGRPRLLHTVRGKGYMVGEDSDG
jgi:DNA-binding response OmpR family regulator